MTTKPEAQRPPPDSQRRASERNRRFREALEKYWQTPLDRPVDLNWALEIRSPGRRPDPVDRDEF